MGVEHEKANHRGQDACHRWQACPDIQGQDCLQSHRQNIRSQVRSLDLHTADYDDEPRALPGAVAMRGGLW